MAQVTPETNRITVDVDLSDTNDSARALLDTLDTIRERHGDIIAGVLEWKVTRLDVRPGDTVVLSTSDHLTHDQAKQMWSVFADALPTGVKALVFDGRISVSVLGQSGTTEAAT